MIIGNKDLNKDLFFVVEEGQFNLGNFEKAINMIELASMTGADAIEFQLAYADDFYIQSDSGFEIYKTREFSDEQFKKMIDFSKSKNLEFIATCLSHNLVPKMANFGASAFNLNASDINNEIMIDSILSTGIPFFVSTPLASEEEISWVVNRIKSQNDRTDFAILHGQHSMASGHEWVSPEDTSLGYIRNLKTKFDLPIGFIDHTPFNWMPSVAVAAGATIISKHMSPSKLYNGPDWQICLEPTEMKNSIENARKIYKSTIITDKKLAKGEDLDKKIMRRSIVASKDIEKGEIISYHNISYKRPGTGVSLDLREKVLGKKAKTDIKSDEFITLEMIENDF